MRSLLHSILNEKNLPSFMETAQSEVMQEKAAPATLEKIVSLILVYIHYKKNLYSKFQESQQLERNYETSIH